PNKAMHIGHLRNSCIGDTVARILRKNNYEVEVQNYVDDTGVQVVDTLLGLEEIDKEKPEDQPFDHFCWDIYAEINSRMKEDRELQDKEEELLRKIEERDPSVAERARSTAKRIVNAHLKTCENFNIGFDLLVWESDILEAGFWNQTFEELKNKDNFTLKDFGPQSGCWVVETDSDEFSDKVFVKSDGTATYTAKDLAYHRWKFGVMDEDFKYKEFDDPTLEKQPWSSDMEEGNEEEDFGEGDRVVNVIDISQRYPQAVLKKSLESLGYEKQAENFRHLKYAMVFLSLPTAEKLGVDIIEEKDQYSISGRRGIGITVDDLLDLITERVEEEFEGEEYEEIKEEEVDDQDIAAAAIRYHFLKYDSLKPVVFDLEDSIQVLGDTGPYLQYSYARAQGILRKAKKEEYLQEDLVVPENLEDPEAHLIKLLTLFPDKVKQCGDDLDVNTFTDYAFDLAHGFNYFYEEAPVLGSEGDRKEFRLFLVKAFSYTMKNLLDILGIIAPERI
ncbi:MAG: arginine--tRNA ligase, partial [Candidatus Paceibacterota bacterium]